MQGQAEFKGQIALLRYTLAPHRYLAFLIAFDNHCSVA